MIFGRLRDSFILLSGNARYIIYAYRTGNVSTPCFYWLTSQGKYIKGCHSIKTNTGIRIVIKKLRLSQNTCRFTKYILF